MRRRLARIGLTGVRIVADLDMILDCCPRVIVLDGGQVVAEGAAAELMCDRELKESHGLEVPYRLQGDWLAGGP